MDTEHQIPALVKDLAEGISVQAKTLNRFLLGLIVLAIFIVLPEKAEVSGSSARTLPFRLGTVDAAWFDPIACAIMSVLSIAFSSAHAAVLRATKLAHRAIDHYAKEGQLPSGITIRDVFDSLRVASFTRVAPLPQMLRGEYQFSERKSECPRWRLVWTARLYCFLKCLSVTVYVLLPMLALGTAYVNVVAGEAKYTGKPVVVILISIFSISALFCLFVIGCNEVRYMLTVYSKITSDKPDPLAEEN